MLIQMTSCFVFACFHVFWAEGSVILCSQSVKQLLSLNSFRVVAGVDYILETAALTFGVCDPMECGIVRALDDCVLEEDETFRMTLTIPSGQDPRINVDKGEADVTIVDQDSMPMANVTLQ